MNPLIRTCVLLFLFFTSITGWSEEILLTKSDYSPQPGKTIQPVLPTVQWSNLPPELGQWQGTWNCYHYGKMYLIITDPNSRKIAGNYTFSNGQVQGRIGQTGENLYGRWQQPNGGGAFHFQLGQGKFGPGWAGRWNYATQNDSPKKGWIKDPWDCTKVSDDIIP